jgi:hypothetical protein
VVAADTVHELKVDRVKGLLKKYDSQGIPESKWRNRLKSSDRDLYDDALEVLAA